MKDVKISKKLFYGFGSMGLLVIIIAGIAFYGVLMGDLRTEKLFKDNMTASDAVGEMREAFQEQRAITRSFILYDINSENYKNSVAHFDLSETNMNNAFTKYEGTVTKKEDRELFEKVKALYNGDYKIMKTELRAFADKSDSDNALQTLNGGSKIVTNLTNYFDEMTELNKGYANETMAESRRGIILVIAIGVPLILISIFWTLFLVKYFRRNVANKISKVVDAANELAVGNIDINLTVDSKDEVGELAAAFNEMILSIKEQSHIAEELAKGNLTLEHTPHSEKDVMGMAFVKTIDGLNQIFDVITTAVTQVNAGAGEVSNGAQSLSQGATEQASSVEELSATITNISNQVLSNATNASNARELSAKAGQEVESGNKQMNKMISAMNDINHSSVEISKIIKVIDDIAFQTNILALNAAVEAARAGAAGKGFAVVAEEVRNLAAKSAEAAKDTTSLIQNSIDKVNEGTKIADATAVSLKEIIVSVDEVSKLIHEIDVASSQQATSLAQVSQGIEQISSVVQTNAATAEESAAASEELSSQAHMLENTLAVLKLKNN